MTAISTRPSALLPVLAGTMLASCSPPPIEMEVADVGGQKVVTLFTRTFGFRRSEPPCIRTVTVSSFGARPEPKPVWSAAAPDEVQCTDLSSFVIGRAPPGFTETMHMAPGEMRGSYRVEVAGIGSGDHDIVF